MRKYRKRAPEQRTCAHCGAPFESAHKRRIYCGNSCTTLACYARKAQRAPGLQAPQQKAEAADSTPVTLAANFSNMTLLTSAVLLADVIKLGIDWLLTPAPQAGPSTWLPVELRTLTPPQQLLLHPSWPEPRLFRPLPYQGEVYYYRAADELLFWLAPDGQPHQFATQKDFHDFTARIRLRQLVQRYVPTLPPAELPPLPTAGTGPLKTLG